MKYLYILFFSLLTNILSAQSNKNDIYGTWVSSKVTYKDGRPLPDEHTLKYVYIKYQFSRSGTLNTSLAYYEQGTESSFECNDGYLYTKFPQGGIMNTYRVELLKDTLILTQRGANGFDDPDAITFYFVPEPVYQNSLMLHSDDIFSIRSRDTIYKQCRKIYAKYNGQSFQRYMYEGIKGQINMDGRAGHLAATFIVSKTGIADSLRILEGIDDEFNKRFIKVFNRSRKEWKPATLNGRPVSVQMVVELRYSTSAATIPSYFATLKANEAYQNKDYEVAIYYYDKALQTTPADKENLYRRGMCKFQLGNKDAACEDWNKAKSIGLGNNIAIDAMIEKYCK
jgi:tetratricopeptide (TPR) repeat protein